MSDVTVKLSQRQIEALRRFIDSNRPEREKLIKDDRGFTDAWLVMNGILDAADHHEPRPVNDSSRTTTIRMRRVTPPQCRCMGSHQPGCLLYAG